MWSMWIYAHHGIYTGDKYVPINKAELQHRNALHISIISGYISSLSPTCDFPELPSAQLLLTHHPDLQTVESFKRELKMIFVVPRLNKFHQSQNRINKFHLLHAFLSFLLQLLYHKIDPRLDPFQDRIENLEKELRFLFTILGDISWMLINSDVLEAEFKNLLPGFEAVANQAGVFIHSVFFTSDLTFGKKIEGLAAVLKYTDHLKAHLQSSIIIPAYATPRASMVDSILIVYSLVDDLEDLLTREDGRIADVKNQVKILYQELLLSHSSIKDLRSPQVEEVKEVVMRIGAIAHQAEYLIAASLVKDAPPWYASNRLTDLGRRIEPLRKELEVITQKYRLGGLNVAEHCSVDPALHDKKNANQVINDITVGFEDKTIEILYQLVGGGIRSLQVISILGMAGLGKTTLAKTLHNHALVNQRFDKLAWCVVSRTNKTLSIFADILIHIDSELEKDVILNMEELSLAEHIHKTLMGRRYLIVLDDVWDSHVLDELVRCFPDDGNGSRILLTSRNKNVAPPNSIIHELPFLSDEQCWELLEKKTFGSRTCPPQLQRIGKKIAARCCGLPLTVVVIAGVLSTGDEDESTWEKVGGSLASYIDGEDNSVMQILELSYKHLPDHLKPCFLYFGEFKEDKEISVQKLKRLWVAEGFIRKQKDKSAENIAEEYLMELIDKSLVMIVKRRTYGRGVKTCVVHDLLRDLCLKISDDESFLKYLDNDYLHTIYKKGHRVRGNGESASLNYCLHVRSYVADQQSSSFYVRDMRLLRVLYFKSIYGLEKLTFGIEYLVNLRFLVIQNLPTWIDRLVNLEYVSVEQRETYLPQAIVKMKKLRYFRADSVQYGDDGWYSDCGINNLEYLSQIKIKEAKDEMRLKCFPRLRKLKCYYEVPRMKHTEKKACAKFDLRFLTKLESLSLHGPLRNDNFRFSSNIRKLTLTYSDLHWKTMSIIGRLQNLEILKVNAYAFEGERWDTRDGEFQNLRFLQLEEIPLSEWNVASNEHFPILQKLILKSCMNLQEIPIEIGEIATLELIQLEGRFLKSAMKSAQRITEEQQEMGNEELRVIIKR